MKNLTIKTRMHLIVALALIIIAGIVALLVFKNTDKKNTDLKPEQLALSLIKDKNFLNSIKIEPQKEKEIT